MWKDLSYSIRTLRRSPIVSIIAVLSLALGIGVNAAIFSLLDQVVLRSLPVRDPESLVVVHREYSPNGTSSSDNNESVFSYPMYRDLRDRDPAFAAVIARMGAPARLTTRDATESARGEIVSGNFFRVLGIGAAAGRVLMPEDDGAPGAHPVAVLSHRYWSAHFAGSPAVVNESVNINGHPFVIVGVAEARFNSLMQGDAPDLFVPIAMQRAIVPAYDALENRQIRWLNVFARLKPGENLRRAQAATDVAYHTFVESEAAQAGRFGSDRARNEFLNHRVELRPAAQGISALRDRWSKPLEVLTIMVGLVLLIACANVAGLLLARAAGRQREIAIRLSLGAGRMSLVRQLLIEGVLLAIVGGSLGVLLQYWSTQSLLRILPGEGASAWLTAGFDPRLLAFALALSLASGILFSLTPALQASKPDLIVALKDQAARSSSGAKTAGMRQALVTTQIAVSMLLLVGALLFTASARNLLNSNLGFHTERLLSFNVNATLGRGGTAAVAFYRDLEQSLASVPEVLAVAAANGGPFGGGNRGGNITVAGYHAREDEYTGATIVAVNAGFFRVLGIPLRAGREFTARDDAAAPKAVVVNETFARRYFGASNPLGHRLMFGASNHPDFDKEIVGVVADMQADPRTKAKETLYIPYAQWDKPDRLIYYVRTAGDEHRVASSLRIAVRVADAELPAPDIKSIELRLRESLYTERLIAILSAAFGGLATLLSAIGLYGVMAYAVARRTGEIGVRMALGALPADVLAMILRDSGKVAALGILIGAAASFVLGRFIESQLFGIKAGNPLIFAGSAATLAAVALMAAIYPAWKASRTDPLSALKYE